MGKPDFAGWATRANLKCSDGLVIMPDAFKDDDKRTVPLVWNHRHESITNVLGHALLENRKDGVYAECFFNDTINGRQAKETVRHGDIVGLSIYANKLKKNGSAVMHGVIREVSLVLAGANPGAYIEEVIEHGEESGEAAVIYTGEPLSLCHSDEEEKETEKKDNGKKDDEKKESESGKKTYQDIIDTMNPEQQFVLYDLLEEVAKGTADNNDDDEEDVKHSEGDDVEMKYNAFDQENREQHKTTLSHSDEEAIMELAKNPAIGTLQNAMKAYVADNKDALAHGIDSVEDLFPEYELQPKGEPERLTRDYTWVDSVLNKAHKSPYSRVKTRHTDIRDAKFTAQAYVKGNKKVEMPNWKLVTRSVDPQMVYIKDKLDREDIIDIIDFDVVSYQQKIMRELLNELLAKAILVGDGLEEGADGKIDESHIKSIWHDDELYTIHYDVDIDAAKTALQGTNTSANFSENYIYAEAIISAALYSRENYKGSGSLEFYCTPHLLNVMLLARDLNGRRIYDSKSDLAAALNVTAIHTVEQFEGLTRTYTPAGSTTSVTKKLLGIFVNMSDYQIGNTKGGEVTNFSDFDIDFNQYKYLIETRLSGALTKLFSAIALEEPVTTTTDSTGE